MQIEQVVTIEGVDHVGDLAWLGEHARFADLHRLFGAGDRSFESTPKAAKATKPQLRRAPAVGSRPHAGPRPKSFSTVHPHGFARHGTLPARGQGCQSIPLSETLGRGAPDTSSHSTTPLNLGTERRPARTGRWSLLRPSMPMGKISAVMSSAGSSARATLQLARRLVEAVGEDAEELPEHLHRDLVLLAQDLEEVARGGWR